ncbi:MAG: TonB-dependent receptor, partial [Sphingobium sp.]
SQWVDYRDRTYQEELQLKGTYDRFSFTTGVYLFHEWWYTNRRANTGANFTRVNGNGTTTSISNSNVASEVRYNPIYTEIRQKTDNIAWYGEGKYSATDALTLTAGLRINYERHSNNNQLYSLSTTPVDATNFYQILFSAPKALIWSVNPHQSWTTWQPRVSLDYKFTPDVTAYGTVARGTKSAGYEFRAQTASNAGRLQAELPFNPEVVTSYEIGVKTKWLNGRVIANLTGFYLNFDDIQITTTDSQNAGISRRFNAGKGSSRGVEFEAQLAPSPGLVFDVNGAYLDARLDEYIGAVNVPTVIPANVYYPNGASINNQPFVGARLANSPKWQGRAAVTWELPLAVPGAIAINADVNYQSSSYTNGNNAITSRLPEQTLINARLSYTTEDGHWTAALSARNLLDKQYAMGAGYTIDGNSGAARLPAWRSANLTDPRTILFTITFRR